MDYKGRRLSKFKTHSFVTTNINYNSVFFKFVSSLVLTNIVGSIGFCRMPLIMISDSGNE